MIAETNLISSIAAVSLITVLFVATATDVISHRIPNILLMPALAIALILGTTSGGIAGLLSSIAGLAVGLALLLPLYAAGGMGAGDVKLLGVAGAFLGPEGTLIAGVATFIVGAAFGLIWMFWKLAWTALQNQVSEMTSAPGTLNNLKTANVGKSSTFAYAPAISAGAAIALWEQGWLVALGAS